MYKKYNPICHLQSVRRLHKPTICLGSLTKDHFRTIIAVVDAFKGRRYIDSATAVTANFNINAKFVVGKQINNPPELPTVNRKTLWCAVVPGFQD